MSPYTLFENVITLKMRTQHDNLKKLNEPVDPDHWFESPTLVDAYYAPARNEMGKFTKDRIFKPLRQPLQSLCFFFRLVFPAGILQFPFFNRGAPAYVNYAMIGTVISHEITHGFDDEGKPCPWLGSLWVLPHAYSLQVDDTMYEVIWKTGGTTLRPSNSSTSPNAWKPNTAPFEYRKRARGYVFGIWEPHIWSSFTSLYPHNG